MLLRCLPVVAGLLLICSCGSPAPKAAERTCEVRGEVIRLDPQTRTAVIKHQKICDWMEAMSMEFPVRNAKDFDALKQGEQISATVHIGDPEFWLSDVHASK